MRTQHAPQLDSPAPVAPAASGGAASITFRNLPRAAALTAVGAAAIDLLVYFAAGAIWAVPGRFTALNPLSIVVASVLGVAVAAVGLAVLARLTRRALSIFTVAGVVVTLVSLAGPFQAMAGAMSGMPQATTATGITMLALHILTGGMIVWALPTWARR